MLPGAGRPSPASSACDITVPRVWPRPCVQGEIGQDVQHPIAVPRGLIKLHPDTPKQVRASLGIAHLHPVFGHVPSLNAAHGTQRRNDLKGESLMLAGAATGAKCIDL